MKSFISRMFEALRVFRSCFSDSMRQARECEKGHTRKGRYRYRLQDGDDPVPILKRDIGKIFGVFRHCLSVALRQARMVENGNLTKRHFRKQFEVGGSSSLYIVAAGLDRALLEEMVDNSSAPKGEEGRSPVSADLVEGESTEHWSMTID